MANIDQSALLVELQNQLKTLEQEIEHDRQSLAQDGVTERGGNDSGDESSHELQTVLGVDKAERDVNELIHVEAAIKRLQQGTYGQCSDCEEDISPDRLEANPVAARCIDCQEKRENKQDQRDSSPSL
jgi:DnaK suppressor protein